MGTPWQRSRQKKGLSISSWLATLAERDNTDWMSGAPRCRKPVAGEHLPGAKISAGALGVPDRKARRIAPHLLRLEEELSARENHPGDVFHAGDAFPVLAAGSRIVILVDEDTLMPRCR